MTADAANPPTNGAKKGQLLVDLRTAAALARDYDWRRIRELFRDHPYPPLAGLAAAASDALLSMPAHDVHPGALLQLAHPNDKANIHELLMIFNVGGM